MDLEWKGIHFTDLDRRGGRSVKSSQKPCAVHADARDARVTVSQKACGLDQEWPEAFPRQGDSRSQKGLVCMVGQQHFTTAGSLYTRQGAVQSGAG